MFILSSFSGSWVERSGLKGTFFRSDWDPGFLFEAVKFIWSVVLIVSTPETFLLSPGSGGGETISIYLGVNTSTRDIRKNAKRVFLSILFHGVFATLKKGIASKQPSSYKINSHKQRLFFYSLNCIIRTGWVKPAGGTNEWRNCKLVSLSLIHI